MSDFENPLAADGWVEKFDQAKSKPYYVNTQTKVTQWDRPDALGGASNGAVMDDGMDDGDDIDNMIAKQQPQKANTPHVCNAHTAPWEKRIVRLGQVCVFPRGARTQARLRADESPPDILDTHRACSRPCRALPVTHAGIIPNVRACVRVCVAQDVHRAPGG